VSNFAPGHPGDEKEIKTLEVKLLMTMKQMVCASYWTPFWMLILPLCCHLMPGDTFRPSVVSAENVRLDLTTANGYQWRTSLPNGSKSRGYVAAAYKLEYISWNARVRVLTLPIFSHSVLFPIFSPFNNLTFLQTRTTGYLIRDGTEYFSWRDFSSLILFHFSTNSD
jgi:hypothetical protein